MAANVLFKAGTRKQYDAILTKNPAALYWLIDTQELYKGDQLFGVGLEATQAARGLLSAEDKQKLDALVASGIKDLKPVDASVVVGTDSEDGAKTLGVQLSAVAANALELKSDGLYVEHAEFAIEKQTDADSGFAATYRLKRTVGEASSYVGDKINIPKDFLVQRASVETAVTDDEPYEGAKAGDKYIDFVINVKSGSDTDEHLYVPVNDLVDVYTAGDGIVIAGNQISVTNRTVRELVGVKGKALVFNERDGGGAKFEHNDGTWSFVGVNDGGKGGITGQLYSVDRNAGNLGTRLNMTNDGFYYTKGKTSPAFTASDEIATKGDIEAALAWGELA